MASIRQRGDSFEVQVRRRGFPARTANFSTRRLAERWARKIESEMEEGKHFRSAASRGRTLGEAVDKFVAEYLPGKKDARNSAIRLAWWKKHAGHLKLFDLTGEAVGDYLSRLAAETYARAKPTAGNPAPRRYVRSVKTINRYAAALSRLCTIARKQWRWMEHKPFDGVMREKEPRGNVRFLSTQEYPRFLAACAKLAAASPEGATYEVLARCSLSATTRASELTMRRWREVDLERGEVHIPETKNTEPRTAFVMEGALVLLIAHHQRELAAGRGGPDDYVFASHRFKDKVFDYQPPHKAACALAGLKDFVFHATRHTAATELARQGATDAQLKAVGGWKSNVVSIYTHLAAEDVRGVVQRMNEKKR